MRALVPRDHRPPLSMRSVGVDLSSRPVLSPALCRGSCRIHFVGTCVADGHSLLVTVYLALEIILAGSTRHPIFPPPIRQLYKGPNRQDHSSNLQLWFVWCHRRNEHHWRRAHEISPQKLAAAFLVIISAVIVTAGQIGFIVALKAIFWLALAYSWDGVPSSPLDVLCRVLEVSPSLACFLLLSQSSEGRLDECLDPHNQC